MTTLRAKKRKLTLTIRPGEIWVIERDQAMVVGEVLTFSVRLLEATTISSPDTKCYKGGNSNDYSSTALSGSSSASGDTVVCETVTAQTNDGGSTYAMVVSATVDGETRFAKFMIRIYKPGYEGR